MPNIATRGLVINTINLGNIEKVTRSGKYLYSQNIDTKIIMKRA